MDAFKGDRMFIGNIIFITNGYGDNKGQAQIFKRAPRSDDCHWIDWEPFEGRAYREPVIIKFPFDDENIEY